MKFARSLFSSAGSVAWCISIMSLVSTAAAEEPVSIVEVRGSLRDFVLDGSWLLRHVTLDNSSSSTRHLRIVCSGAANSNQQGLHWREVTLAPKSTLRTELAVFTDNTSADSLPVNNASTFNTNYHLLDIETGRKFCEGYFLNNKIIPGTIPVVALGNQSDIVGESPLEPLLERMYSGGKVIRIVADRAIAPDRWYGYSMSSMLLLGDVDASRLRASQVEAILDWVRHGGILVLTASDQLAGQLQGPLGQAAGVRLLSSHQTISLKPARLDGTSFSAVSYRFPQRMAELCPDNATVLYYANGLPLLTRRSVGAGYVFTLATPMMGIADQRLDDIAQAIPAAGKALPSVDQAAFMGLAGEILNKYAGRRGPAPSVPATILIGLACVGLMGGIAARRWRRGELVWVVMVPLTLLTGIGLAIVSQNRADPQRLSYVGLACGTGEGNLARVQEVFAYGSGNKSQKVDFGSGSYRSIIRRTGQSDSLQAQDETQTAEGLKLAGQTIDANSTRAFATDAVVPVEGPTCNVTFGEKGLAGTLSSPDGLNDSVIYINGRTYRVGAVSAGAEMNLQVTPDDLLGRGEFTTELKVNPERNALATCLFNKRPGRRPLSEAFIVGYAERSPLDPLAGANVAHQGWTAEIWPIKIAPPKPLSKVLVPPGFTEVQLGNKAGNKWGLAVSTVTQSGPGGIDFRVNTPAQVASLEDAKATITLLMHGANYRLAVVGLPEKGNAEVLKTVNTCGGRHVIDVPDANRFRTADGRYYVFGVRLEPVSAGSDSSNSPEWSLLSADVALEGISR